MGSGGSKTEHHHHHHYHVDPATQRALQQKTERVDELEKEAKKRSDPQFYKENAHALFQTFLGEVKDLKLTDVIRKNPGERHVAFFGNTSVGKTSLINAFCKTKLPVALGACTEKCEVVFTKENGLTIWDVNGDTSKYKFYDPLTLGFVKSLDFIAVLFDNDVMMVADILQVVYQLHPQNLVVVRTKIDQHDASNARTIEEESKRDQEIVSKLLGHSLPVFAVSSKNPQLCLKDWQLLQDHIFADKK